MNVFELVATLAINTKDYEKGLSDARTTATSFSNAISNIMKIGAAAIAAVGTAAVAASTSIVKSVNDIAEYGDHIDKMSQKIGISAEAYQEWDAVLQHSGASVDSLQTAIRTLSTQAQKGNEAFQKLGISEKEVSALSQEGLFKRVIFGLQQMGESTERTYISAQLLGRGSTELGALLNTSAEDTKKMIDTVHELGGVMSDEAVKNSAAFKDQLQDMRTASDGIKRNLLMSFMPSIKRGMDALTDLFSGKYDDGRIRQKLEIISGKLGKLADKVVNFLVEDVDWDNVLDGIANGLDKGADALDYLFDNSEKIIPTIKTIIAILTAWKIIQLALNIAMLANPIGLVIVAITALIAAGVALYLNWDTVKERASQLWNSLKNTFNNIGASIKNAFQNAVNAAKNWGSDLINNFKAGITSKLSALKSTVSSMASTIKSYLHFSEPDVGPLSDFHTYAPDMMKLFAQGIADNEHLVTDQIEKSFDFGRVVNDNKTSGQRNVQTGDVNVGGKEIVLSIDGHELARFLAPAMNSQLAFGRV